MGGERASTIRRRERGEICCVCRKLLDPVGERYCGRCGPKRTVYMQFFLRPGWVCNFLEADSRTSVGRVRVLRDDELLRATIERGGGMPDSEARNMVEYAIQRGRGGVTLSLTEAQYQRLKAW